jgi:hypothetical protein
MVDGCYTLHFGGGTNGLYDLYASTNLVTWEFLARLSGGTNGYYGFTDVTATNVGSRFYKLKEP